jgi:serine/threonine protein kinase/Tol biopolymer transport system component
MLSNGTKLGPYEIQSPLGEGGMGEVYRARDTRLGRDVAIKVLPQSFAIDPDRLRRFEQEARAVAALNHPNILGIYDIGAEAGVQYLVTELLEGESLRAKIASGPLGTRRSTEYALLIAHGLGAAHDKGIIHRDLKPENIFVTRDGRVKVLDFGLARQKSAAIAAATAATLTSPIQTAAGLVMGTVGYMAPEQVRGLPVDHRSDIFALGAVLHEMLSGSRAFERDTAAETMTAILKDDPPDLMAAGLQISPALDRIVRRCVEKQPEQRFQSTKDLAFALENISAQTGTTSPVKSTAARNRRRFVFPAAAIAGIILLAAAGISWSRLNRAAPPVFNHLTFARGYVRTARFAPDGQTVVFGGMWNGNPMQVWFQRADSNDFSALPLPRADLLSVSSTGELAIALNRRFPQMNVPVGTLARVPLTGGSPRELLDNVTEADWSPDGAGLAVAHQAGDRFRLEYPIGHILYENTGYISHIRFSHRGDRIAFMDHSYWGDDRGAVCVVDLKGKRQVLTPEWNGQQGLAWSPSDDEIWFSASADPSNNDLQLMAVALSRRLRVIFRNPGRIVLHDIARDGRLLISTENQRQDVMLGDTVTMKERDVTTFDASWYHKLSDDGRWMLFTTSAGGGVNYAVYARRDDGSPAMRLAEGNGQALSRDGKWAAASLPAADSTLEIIPLGVGETRLLKAEGLHYRAAFWLPDDEHLLTVAFESGHDARTYLQSASGSERMALTPEGVEAQIVSPDGRHFVARTRAGKYLVYDLNGGSPRELSGITRDEQIVQWMSSGDTLILSQPADLRVVTSEFDIETGKKKPWKQFVPSDPIALMGIEPFYLTPDGSRYILCDVRTFSALFIASGLK